MFIKTNFYKSKKNIITILILMTIILSPISGIIGSVQATANNTVTARDLAMFASIAYADLENIEGYDITLDSNMDENPKLNILNRITEKDLTFKETPIVSDEQLSTVKTKTSLLGISKESDENTYDYLFYGLASTDEVSDWKLVNYAKFNTTILKGTAEFTAMTFKNGNDIVIAYRGTDFDDIGDWIQDLFYGIVNYAGQEGITQDYAKVVAEYYTKNNNDINIYVTGHSLGGYLAQIGGAALVGEDKYRDKVEEIAYFNGMGLKFWSNIQSKLTPSIISKYQMSNFEINQIKNNNSILNRTQDIAKKSLTNWKNSGGKIISYNINGDVISSLGTHIGEQIGFDAHNACINHHNGNQNTDNVAVTTLFKLIKNFLNKDISKYVEQYKPKAIIDFVWITHETDSFFGVLPYADGTLPVNIKVDFNVPSVIKYNKVSTATLTVITTNGKLENEIIDNNDFIISNRSRIKIISISSPTIAETPTGYKYTYKIELKGGILIGNSNITIRPNTFKIKPNDERMKSNVVYLLQNNYFTSGKIVTKLR